MKKVIILIMSIGIISIGLNLWLKTTPSCTYEYWSEGNSKKFAEACKALKDKNKADRDEAERIIKIQKNQQSLATKANDEIRNLEDKVTAETNAIKQQDSYAFRRAE